MAEVEIPDPKEAKEKAEDPYTKRIALSVAIYAVILAFAAAGGNNAGKDMMMEQQRASNRWAQYQAKAIREALYLNDAEKLEIELAKGSLADEARKKMEDTLKRIRAKLAEYKADKEAIMAKARNHEAARDDAHKRDPYFDFAEVALQIGVVLASVAMLSGKRWAFYVSLVLAVVGAVLTVNGYLLLDGGKFLGPEPEVD
jgi:Flp pilus assembly protein TadB